MKGAITLTLNVPTHLAVEAAWQPPPIELDSALVKFAGGPLS